MLVRTRTGAMESIIEACDVLDDRSRPASEHDAAMDQVEEAKALLEHLDAEEELRSLTKIHPTLSPRGGRNPVRRFRL